MKCYSVRKDRKVFFTDWKTPSVPHCTCTDLTKKIGRRSWKHLSAFLPDLDLTWVRCLSSHQAHRLMSTFSQTGTILLFLFNLQHLEAAPLRDNGMLLESLLELLREQLSSLEMHDVTPCHVVTPLLPHACNCNAGEVHVKSLPLRITC